MRVEGDGFCCPPSDRKQSARQVMEVGGGRGGVRAIFVGLGGGGGLQFFVHGDVRRPCSFVRGSS